MSKRATLREKRRRKKQRERLTIGFIITGVAAIVLAVILLPYLQPVGAIVTPPVVERTMVEGNAIGDPNAPVVLQAFSDFQCGHCRNFNEMSEPLLVDEYVKSGKLYIIYNAMALYSSSVPISEASLCAREQDKFWEYKDIVFANQNLSDPDAFSDRRLQAFAEAIGLDVDAFKECTSERRYKEEVEQIRASAEELGITGTPTFLINGTVVRGNQPIDVFRQAIEAALARAEDT